MVLHLLKTTRNRIRQSTLMPVIWDIYTALPKGVRSTIVHKRHANIWEEVNNRQNLVLVHIPKTGGTSLATVLYGHSINHYPLWVWQAANPVKARDAKFVAVLREPLERLVSAIRHCLAGSRASPADLAIGQRLRRTCSNVDEMVEHFFCHAATRRRLQRNIMFKPYQFWLGMPCDRLHLSCLRLTKHQTTPSALRLNVSRGPTAEIDYERWSPMARSVLASDYAWYDRPDIPGLVDASMIQSVLGLSDFRLPPSEKLPC